MERPASLSCGRSPRSGGASRLLLEDVLVLRVAQHERALGAGADHELETLHAGRRGDEREAAIGVLARRHLALPLAEVENRDAAGPADRDLAERRVLVPRSQL